jgi:putative transposase
VDIRMVIATWPDNARRGAVTAFCRRHGVSRSRFYEIRAQAAREGPVAVVSRPGRRPRGDLATPAAVEALALQIRKEQADAGWDGGPLTVRAKLLELAEQGRDEGLFTHVPVPSRATLARIFTRHGAVVPAPNKRPHASYRAFTFPRVHDCWQLDATEWRLADGSKVVVFQLEDDHSRYIVASRVAWSENSAAAVAVMRAAVAAHQAPVLLLTDNGVAMNPHRRGLTSQLAAYARALGTRAITSRIYHPQTAGKNERLHGTLKRWLRARPLPADLQQLTDWITVFDAHYNHRRPHQSLHQRTPAQVLATGPRALPPDPPPPPATTTATTTTTTTTTTARKRRQTPTQHLRRVRVLANGSVRVSGGYYIGLGVEYGGSHVLTLVKATTITIFDMHGTELRTVHPVPGQIYYGTGRPSGGPCRRPHPLTDSNPNQLSGPN